MDMQNVSNLQIPEGEVRTIHDKDGRLLWGRLNYNTKYAGDTYQQTYSGKNLYQSIGATSNGITGMLLADGTLQINGTATSNSSNFTARMSISLPAGTYTFSLTKAAPFRILMRSNLGQNHWVIEAGQTSATQTVSSGITELWVWGYNLTSGTSYNFDIGFQLEAGSSASLFEPYVGGIPSPNPDYPQAVQTVTGEQTVAISDGADTQSFTVDLGSTELCKIGDRQDYIYKGDDGWYVHKETGRRTYSGSDVYLDSHSYTNIKYAAAPKPTDSDAYGVYGQKLMYCTHASATGNTGTWDSAQNIGKILSGAVNIAYWVGFPPNTTLDTMQTALDGSVLYYVLATPTDTKITDTMLIGQLNTVHEWLTRYGYNSTVTGNLPIIIDRTNL